MPQIKPLIGKQESICAETPGDPCGIIVFGASGDLTKRKLIPSLFALFQQGLLSDNFYFVGCGRKDISDSDYKKTCQEAIAENINSSKQADDFLDKIYFISGNYDDPSFYTDIKNKLKELDKKYSINEEHIFYLSVPPQIYPTIVQNLGSSSLSCKQNSEPKQKAKLIIEKPFGRDLQSAIELNKTIHKCFDESQIYRIDHYLGKETVQNILMFRFANAIFEPVWNLKYIDHVQITIAESLGIEHRGGYYDKSGALRDMFQNHMLGMLALVAMEPPASFQADHIRDEKVKLLRSIRSVDLEAWSTNIVRGRYSAGKIEGQKVCAYKDEEGVEPDSKTETYVAAKMYVDNWRWESVPFYLRTGKRMKRKLTEIAITFKKVPHSMFNLFGIEDLPANVLVLKIQPNEGIELSFQAKRPGSKACISTLNMNFNYSDIFGTKAPEAYQRLLLDCMTDDQTLFTRQDDVEVSWGLVEPLLKKWENDGSEPSEYPSGAESFADADTLIKSDGHSWRPL
jgi:glucose-6-phosphate 1-dehydrogenase